MKKATKRKTAKKQSGGQIDAAKRIAFVHEYLIDMDATKAAARAGYSEASARQQGYKLLKVPEIAAAIKAAQDERAERTKFTADDAFKRMVAIVTADASEICELRRTCWRFCWGRENRYQRTPSELREAIAQFNRDKLKVEAGGLKFTATFDEEGGTGFDKRREPNPKCMECFGEGVETPFFKDTRRMSKDAKVLYAGVEVTQHGLKVKTHNQADMLVNVGKHLGMFTEKVKHSNDPDNPMPGYVIVPPKRSDDAAPSG